MPGDSVTLWILCEHGEARRHPVIDGRAVPWHVATEVAATRDVTECPGGRPPTVADLVSALRAEGVLDITKLIEYGPSGPRMTFRYVLNLPVRSRTPRLNPSPRQVVFREGVVV